MSDGALETFTLGDFTALAAGDPADPLVLVLHGFPDAPTTFAPLVTGLAASGYRVVAPWLRGYAPSPLAGPYDADTLAADVVAWIDALSPDRPAALVGHDWGALVTYVASLRAPSRIAAAVAMSVPHPRAFVRALASPLQLARSWYMLAFQLPGSERAAAAFDFALVDRLWRTWSPGFTLDDATRRALHDTLRASWPAPLLYYRALLRPVGSALDRLRRTERIDVPTLYLHGTRDGCIGPRAGLGSERWFRGGYRRELVAGAGHFLAAERPRELVAWTAAWLAQYVR